MAYSHPQNMVITINSINKYNLTSWVFFMEHTFNSQSHISCFEGHRIMLKKKPE